MQRVSGRLWEVVPYESWTAEGFFQGELSIKYWSYVLRQIMLLRHPICNLIKIK